LLFKVRELLLLLPVAATASVLPQEVAPSFLGPNSRLTGRTGGLLPVVDDVAGIVIEVAILSTAEADGVDVEETTVLSQSMSVVNPLPLSS